MSDQSEQQRRLGRDADQFSIHTLDELRTVSQDLLAQARLTVDIMTRDLDRRIYDDDACLAAIRGSPYATARRESGSWPRNWIPRFATIIALSNWPGASAPSSKSAA